jgi:hypothetical protein
MLLHFMIAAILVLTGVAIIAVRRMEEELIQRHDLAWCDRISGGSIDGRAPESVCYISMLTASPARRRRHTALVHDMWRSLEPPDATTKADNTARTKTAASRYQGAAYSRRRHGRRSRPLTPSIVAKFAPSRG